MRDLWHQQAVALESSLQESVLFDHSASGVFLSDLDRNQILQLRQHPKSKSLRLFLGKTFLRV